MPRLKIHPITLFLFASLIILDGTAVSLIPFGAALCHELGHLIVMYAAGVRVSEVEITLFGAEIKALPSDIGDICRIAVFSAGAAANILTACAAAWLFDGVISDLFVACSVCLALFNMLPIVSLDGGCIAQVILMRMFPLRYDMILKGISVASLCLLWLIAVYLLLVSGGNISLMLFCMYMFSVLYLGR